MGSSSSSSSSSPFSGLAFLVCFLFSSIVGASASTCNQDDHRALVEFARNLADGFILSNWSKTEPCCRWDGVVCSRIGNGSSGPERVAGLLLPGRGLRGTFAGSLGRSGQLRRLDLSRNLLKGGIPQELSNLSLLEDLDLSYNELSGPITPVGGMAGLRMADLSSNYFNGSRFHFGALPRLSYFNISNNSLVGSIGPDICIGSKAIRALDLSSNLFSGALPVGGGPLDCHASLQELHLGFNLLSGGLSDSLFDLVSLERLSLSSNDFSGNLSSELNKLSSLRTLVLSVNRFSGRLPDVFGNLTKLEQLVASSNSFSGMLPDSLSQCSMLRDLDLRNNSFAGSINLNFTSMPYLRDLLTLQPITSRVLSLPAYPVAKN